MWAKTLIGFLVSLLLYASVAVNVLHLFPLPQDILLLIAFVGGFLFWGVAMTVFYCADSLSRPLCYGLALLAASAGVNCLFYFNVLGVAV